MAKKNHAEITANLNQVLTKWDKEQTVSDFVKEELMEIDPRTNRTLRSSVVKRLVYLTENAVEDSDQIKAADTLLKMAAAGDVKALPPTEPNQINNFFSLASSHINETVQSLIDVTPKGKKKGIEALI
jgi:hypothetical protein